MTKRNPEYCNVIIKDGMQLVAMPGGTAIPCQVWTRVTDKVGEKPYVILKLFVNIGENG